MTRILRATTVAAVFVLTSAGIARAMPPFAEAYGMKCDVCHTQVPALNAYGRYLQRTGYATLDPHTLHRSTPFWIGENAKYSHNADDASPPRTEFGNLAIHAAGAFDNNTTYHLHTWVVQDGRAGGVDTLWVTFNNLFNRNGHLFVGKMPGPVAAPFSNWFDLASFSTPEITVGEHVYQNDANRWGTKFRNQSGNIDFSYHLAKYLHVYAESAMAQNARPTWSYMIWWTMPLQKVK